MRVSNGADILSVAILRHNAGPRTCMARRLFEVAYAADTVIPQARTWSRDGSTSTFAGCQGSSENRKRWKQVSSHLC